MPKETAKIEIQNARDAAVDLPAGEEGQPLHQSDVRGQPDGERRQENVPADHPGELQSRKQERVDGGEPLAQKEGVRFTIE